MSEKIASRPSLLHLGGMLSQHMPADLPQEVVQEWTEDDGPEALTQLLSALRDGPFSIAQVKIRETEVTIYPKRTVEEWVAAGKYNCANPNLNTTNFEQFLTVKGTEPYQAKVVAFCLGRSVTIDKAKRIRPRLNLKPIGFEHEAAVGEQHPELQRELNWLVNPDAVWVDPDEYRRVSYLYGRPDYRNFRLVDAGGEWDDRTWFFGLSE